MAVAFALGGVAAPDALLAAESSVLGDRPVRLVVGFPPGGATDATARILSPRMQEALGPAWVVDNRGGAGGNLATELVVRAAPDGHTVLLAVSTSLTSNPHLYKLAVDVERDLLPVLMMTSAQYMLVVHSTVKATSLKDFLALVRAQPGRINYASTGIGTPQHLAAELFKLQAGLDLVHIPYKGGGPASAAILGNEVSAMFGSLPSLLQHVRSGRIRALAVSGAHRAAAIPEVPTVAESGFPGFEMTSWYALMLPARTPAPIAETIHKAARATLQLADVREAIQREGLEVTIKDARELAQIIRNESVTMAKVIRAARIRVD
jgi:tripartite-type tricarboxylate transporter receptor subunit TctC